MADRVHPSDSLLPTTERKVTPPSSPDHPQSTTKPAAPMRQKPGPQPGIYVIQVAKDQVYRVPPPENAKRFKQLSRQKASRSRSRRCCCCFLGAMASIVLLAGIAAGVIYLVFRPEKPNYTIKDISINGFNLNSSASISPAFNITLRAENPNNKIGIYYLKGSSAEVYYGDVRLSGGALPAFHQGPNNVTVIVMALKESAIELTSRVRESMVDEESKGTVPFKLKFSLPVKIELGDLKTWKITFKVRCDVTVDNLRENSKVQSQSCSHSVRLW